MIQIDMPTSCKECKFVDNENATCRLNGKELDLVKGSMERQDECLLIEIKGE